ncbi:MAG: nitroreductase family protein [Pseudomonadota bacterium]
MVSKLLAQRYGSAAPEIDETQVNETLASMLAHRAHRRFTDQAVEPRLLDTLLAVAFSAPSKSDLQQACVITVDDSDKKSRLAASQPYLGWIKKAPVLMVWCGDNRRIRKVCERRDHPFANDHLDSFFNAAVDTGIVMQAFIIAAESAGLGCCPLSQIRDSIELLSDELDLPEHVFPVAGLAVGWPQESPPISMRLPPRVTVHRDRYDDSGTMRAIEVYDTERENAQPTAADSQRDAATFGTYDQYGWSEDKARQYSQPMREDFGAYIRRQGFNLD